MDFRVVRTGLFIVDAFITVSVIAHNAAGSRDVAVVLRYRTARPDPAAGPGYAATLFAADSG